VEKKHRVAVLRAADNVAKRLGCWEKYKCERFCQTKATGLGSVYVNVTNVHSYAIGRLRTDFLSGSPLDVLEAKIAEGGDDRYTSLVVKGGAWWVHVEIAKAKRGMPVDGEIQAMIAKQEADDVASATALANMFGKPNQKKVERRQRRKEANKTARACGKCGTEIQPGAPIVRALISEDSSLFGRSSTSTMIEVQCEACLKSCGHQHWYSGRYTCNGCGRKVYQRSRYDRKRTFCCEYCKKKGAARLSAIAA
jgi:hypothetical protein